MKSERVPEAVLKETSCDYPVLETGGSTIQDIPFPEREDNKIASFFCTQPIS